MCKSVSTTAHLDVIRDEDSTAETASDATHDVDDTNPQRTEQLLQMSHEHKLKDKTEQQL